MPDQITIILENFNALNKAWFSTTQDDRAVARGNRIFDALDHNQLMQQNTDNHTRLPSKGRPHY